MWRVEVPPREKIVTRSEAGPMTYMAKSDAVAAALRELVITGEIAPGTELRQRELATRFGVSATPVREALKRLESEGLIEYHVHRSARVIDTGYEGDEENFLIRASLEGLASALAAHRATPDDIDALEDINRQLANCREHDGETAELNRRFHFRLFETAESPLLLSLLRLLWHSFPSNSMTGRGVDESVAQHEDIIEALRANDTVRAELTTRDHILAGRGFDGVVLPGLLDPALLNA